MPTRLQTVAWLYHIIISLSTKTKNLNLSTTEKLIKSCARKLTNSHAVIEYFQYVNGNLLVEQSIFPILQFDGVDFFDDNDLGKTITNSNKDERIHNDTNQKDGIIVVKKDKKFPLPT